MRWAAFLGSICRDLESIAATPVTATALTQRMWNPRYNAPLLCAIVLSMTCVQHALLKMISWISHWTDNRRVRHCLPCPAVISRATWARVPLQPCVRTIPWTAKPALPAVLAGLTRGRCCNRVNITLGPKEERLLMTGLHTVADIYCTCCNTTLGWKYVSTLTCFPSALHGAPCQPLRSRTRFPASLCPHKRSLFAYSAGAGL